MPKKNGRNRSRIAVTSAPSLSLSQLWDSKLARTKDSCHLSDRVPIGPLVSSTGISSSVFPISVVTTNGSSVTPGALGQRVFAIGQNYTRYRVNRLLATYRPIVGTTTAGLVGIGFSDDPINGFANVSNPGFIEELRCSHADSVYREIEVEWKPIDKTAWYFVQPDVTAVQTTADQRLEYPCALCVSLQFATAVASTTYALVSLYYDITFEGAESANLLA
jgi:hypothetical protein